MDSVLQEWTTIFQLVDTIQATELQLLRQVDEDFLDRCSCFPAILLDQSDVWCRNSQNAARILKMYNITPLGSYREQEFFDRLSSIGFFEKNGFSNLEKNAIDVSLNRVDNCGNNCLQRFCLELDENSAVATIEQMDAQILNSANFIGLTAARFAASNNLKQVLNALIEKGGVDFNLPDHNGNTPLLMACAHGHNDFALAMLIRIQNLSLDCREFSSGCTALHYAFHHGLVTVCKVLLEKGASMHVKSKNQVSPYDLIFQTPTGKNPDLVKKKMQCVNVLVEKIKSKGIDVRDECGYTPLHHAAKKGSVSAIELLLEKGADPAIVTNSKMTALHICCIMRHQKCAALLISKMSVKALNLRDSNQQTALFCLTSQRNVELVTALLARGVDPLNPEEWKKIFWEGSPFSFGENVELDQTIISLFRKYQNPNNTKENTSQKKKCIIL